MSTLLQITATVERPDLLKDLVEKLADRRYDIGYSDSSVPSSWRALETSSIETYVSGTVALADSDAEGSPINMPFTTQFLFTCVKEKGSAYMLSWSSSLS